MPHLSKILERQSEQIEEFRGLIGEGDTSHLPALGISYHDRGETLVAQGKLEGALDDQREAAAVFAHLVLREGRADLVGRMLEAGASARATFLKLGREREATDHALGEASILFQMGDAEGAIAAATRLVSAVREALEAGATPERLDDLVKVQLSMGGMLHGVERFEDALSAQDEALEVVRRFQEGDPLLPWSIRSNRAMTLALLGRQDEALAEHAAVIEALEGMMDDAPGGSLVTSLANALGRRAELLLGLERLDEAFADLARGAALEEERGRRGDDVAAMRAQAMLRQRGRIALHHGRPEDAAADCERARAILLELSGRDGSLEVLEELTESGYDCGLAAFACSRFDGALAEAERFISTFRRLARDEPDRLDRSFKVIQGLDLRERALFALGRMEEALADQSAIIEGFEALLAKGAPPHLRQGLAITLERRAQTQRELGRLQEAMDDRAAARRWLSEGEGQ